MERDEGSSYQESQGGERERERECERGSEGVFNRVREIEEVR